jgi:alanine-glyoxylate transaminase/serine-glyoxylate transaminase/serine-pyruvate transaminase
MTKFGAPRSNQKMLDQDELLLIPGPTTLSSKVREVMARPQLSHVAPEFYNAFKELLELSRYLFGNTAGLQFVFTGSGSIGMESAIVSLFEPGDRVLSLETGYFGRRFTMMAEIHGCKVDSIASGLGAHTDYDAVSKKLSNERFKALLFTHIDTSTSVMNDIERLTKIASDNGTLSICDSVCGIGGAPLKFDELGADVVLTGSQKAIAAPPGATLIALSRRAFEVVQTRKTPIASYYMNLARWKPIMEDPRIYLTTPAVQVMLALREALLEIKREGIENRWRRHETLARALRAGLEAFDLKLVAEQDSRSPTVTAFYVPHGKSSSNIQEILRLKYGIHIAKGFGELADKTMRIGHFGNVSSTWILGLLSALELVSSGKVAESDPRLGRAPEAALSVLSE